jgi:hypothetical protein
MIDLKCCLLLHVNTIWLMLDIPISIGILVHINVIDILYKILDVVDNQEIMKKYLIVHTHLYVM